jgi:hypothetical protein
MSFQDETWMNYLDYNLKKLVQEEVIDEQLTFRFFKVTRENHWPVASHWNKEIFKWKEKPVFHPMK